MAIHVGDVVQINQNSAGVTLCRRAEVLHVPVATGDCWGFRPIESADMREVWTNEPVTLYKESK